MQSQNDQSDDVLLSEVIDTSDGRKTASKSI